MFRNKTGVALRDLLESKGEDGAQIIVREALKGKKLSMKISLLKKFGKPVRPLLGSPWM